MKLPGMLRAQGSSPRECWTHQWQTFSALTHQSKALSIPWMPLAMRCDAMRCIGVTEIFEQEGELYFPDLRYSKLPCFRCLSRVLPAAESCFHLWADYMRVG